MSKGVVAGMIGSLLVIGLISNACSEESPASSGPPVTVQSVQTFADFTLSDGRQVHDVLFDSTAVTMLANPVTNSGHPCLPGERDGDHDGYCGEGR